MKLKSPKIGDLDTRTNFYEYAPNDGPEPGEAEEKVLYSAWANVDSVWLKDIEMAKTNGTLSDITIIIRDPQPEFIPNNKHYLSIDALGYRDKRYNIKQVQPYMQNKRFITIVVGLKEWV
ncbi:head-tail adaptor protein [Bacillus sp. MUM 116]|uniref:phage head completion protein n=1 Tax=Bacillus sp. MUM 116 TaxID=1678002 RepID=UPI00210D644D|nr:head-tail adaptor protein [Bacillus sp. MUM 116]